MQANNTQNRKSRIPLELQNIFVASQTGIDVGKITAPRDGMGFRMFNNKNAKGHCHQPVAHQSIPRPPRQSSLSRMRRNNSNNSLASSDSSKASEATKKVMKEKGTRAKKHEEGSPQAFLNMEFKKRGYSTKTYSTLEGGYYCRPNPWQLASYGRVVTKAMYRPDNSRVLLELLHVGISPNACNKFGESVVHLVARRGHNELLLTLMDAGCSLKVSDDYGRTPLHDACWQSEPNWATVRLILEADKHLIRMLDIRGTTPLAYIKKENYGIWIKFLSTVLDEFWPQKDMSKDTMEEPPPFTMKPPHSVPLRVPHISLSLDQIQMVTSGELDPKEAMYLAQTSDETDSSYYSSDSSYCSDSDYDMDDKELAEVCMLTGNLSLKEFCVR